LKLFQLSSNSHYKSQTKSCQNWEGKMR
jgi:hypothetical protein